MMAVRLHKESGKTTRRTRCERVGEAATAAATAAAAQSAGAGQQMVACAGPQRDAVVAQEAQGARATQAARGRPAHGTRVPTAGKETGSLAMRQHSTSTRRLYPPAWAGWLQSVWFLSRLRSQADGRRRIQQLPERNRTSKFLQRPSLKIQLTGSPGRPRRVGLTDVLGGACRGAGAGAMRFRHSRSERMRIVRRTTR